MHGSDFPRELLHLARQLLDLGVRANDHVLHCPDLAVPLLSDAFILLLCVLNTVNVSLVPFVPIPRLVELHL